MTVKVGHDVVVNSHYSGGLRDVIGKRGTVVESDGFTHRLNIRGRRVNPNYSAFYDVLVFDKELDIVDHELKDAQGVAIEIGDKVAYCSRVGTLRIGRVTEIKSAGNSTKFQMEYSSTTFRWDGQDRRIIKEVTRSHWYDYSDRCVVIEKAN